MEECLVQALENPEIMHYKDMWLMEEDQLGRKVLELFSYGTVQDIPKDLALTDKMLTKLQKLTIVSLCEQQRQLSYAEVQHGCQISDLATVEELFIQLRAFFDVKLDSVQQTATIHRMHDCRDVYGGERPLLLIKQPQTTKNSLLRDLRRWKLKLHTEILGEQP